MKNFNLLAMVLITFIFSCETDPIEKNVISNSTANSADMKKKSNAPSLLSFKLIGVEEGKKVNTNGKNNNNIYVKANGKSVIYLVEGDFMILDADATDDNGATIQVPHPDPNNDGITDYSAFAREFGGTFRYVNLMTNYEGEDTASIQDYRNSNDNNELNTTKEMLFLRGDFDADGDIDKVPLFDPAFNNYRAELYAQDLKSIQISFNPEPTDVN